MEMVLRSSTAPVLPESEGPAEIKVSFLTSLACNRHTGYKIANYSLITGHDPEPRIICAGKNLPEDAGFIYLIKGRWDTKRPPNIYFYVDSYSVTDELTKDVIIKFLCSSRIDGCGEKTAERIYELFGTKAIKLLKKDPERLRHYVLPRAKTEQIIKSFHEYARLDEIIRTLEQYGISEDICNKIYDKYKDNSIKIIKEHPYQLCHTYGLEFHVADRIARTSNISYDDYERFCAAARAVLLRNEINTGSTYMYYRRFLDGVFLMLYGRLPSDVAPLDRRPANDNLCQAFRERKLSMHKYRSNQYISRIRTDVAEEKFAEEITRLLNAKVPQIKDIEAKVDKAFITEHLASNADQKAAIITALLNPVSITTGGPGCGKTAIMKILASICSDEYGPPSVLLMAPTGRAARKLNEATNLPAFTIHHTLRLFDSDEGTGEVASDTDIKLNNKLIVIDEASMIDIWVATKLVTAVMNGSRLVFVGDANQLQSVRAGAVLRDLVGCGIVPCSKLTHVFRQKEGSTIIDNSDVYLHGTQRLEKNDKFQMIQCIDGDKMEQLLADAYMKALSESTKPSKDSVICLCPMKGGAAGVRRMNEKLQALVNPSEPSKRQLYYLNTIYREGDVVMETQNSSDVVNGDIGYIVEVDNTKYSEKVIVAFDGGVVRTYTKLELDHLFLAYAMTVHKAQGSEYDTVITSLTFENGPMLVRNLMYTAFTRAKEKVVFIGDERALFHASFVDGSRDRITLLKPRLERKNGMFVSLD